MIWNLNVTGSQLMDTLWAGRALCAAGRTHWSGGRRVSRACPPPPLEIEKQKKRTSEQILSYFTYILLLFQSEISFYLVFSELGPPLKYWKAKKKKIIRANYQSAILISCEWNINFESHKICISRSNKLTILVTGRRSNKIRILFDRRPVK